MAFFRFAWLVLLFVAAAFFAVYAFTGQGSYRKWGMRLLVAAIAGGFVFFAVLAVERLAQ